MKKILFNFLLYSAPILLAEEKTPSGLLDYIKQDIISFVNPKASEIILQDFLLDILVVGAGCILADAAVSSNSICSDLARAGILTSFILSNEYFREKYGKRASTFSKNITYILLYILYKRS